MLSSQSVEEVLQFCFFNHYDKEGENNKNVGTINGETEEFGNDDDRWDRGIDSI